MQLIGKKYKIIKELGRGSSATIYQVEYNDTLYALKVLHPKELLAANFDDYFSAFCFEFSLLREIESPYLIKIHDFAYDTELEVFYIVQDWIDAQSLLDFAQESKSHSNFFQDIQSIFVHCLIALKRIHRAGYMHGDIKPDNILINSKTQEAVLIDLGLSHPKFNNFSGTPAYLAPEKIRSKHGDHRSDIYALALSFYHVLAAKNPLARNNIQQTREAQLKDQVNNLSLENSQVPPYFSKLIQEMLEKNPEDRPASCDMILLRLRMQGLKFSEKNILSIQNKKFIGRPDLKKQISQIKRKLQQSGKVYIQISGASGVGKSYFLNYLSYELAFTALNCSKTDRSADILILDDVKEAEIKKILKNSNKKSLIVSSNQNLDNNFVHFQKIKIENWKQVDLEEFFKNISPIEKISEKFLIEFFELTQGNPRQCLDFLNYITDEFGLMNELGSWNFMPYVQAVRSLSKDYDFWKKELPVSVLSFSEKKEVSQRNLNIPHLFNEIEGSLRLQKNENLDEKINHLESLINATEFNQDKIKFKILLAEKKAWLATQRNNFALARQNLSLCENLLQDIEIEESVYWRIFNFIAYLDLHEDNLDLALKKYKKSYEVWSSLKLKDKFILTNNNLALIYFKKNEFEKSAQIFKEEIAFYKKYQRQEQSLWLPLLRNLTDFAKLHIHQNKNDLAIECLKEASELAILHKHYHFLLVIYNELGNLYLQLENFEMALRYYENTYYLADYIHAYLSAAVASQNLAVIYKDQEKDQKENKEKLESLKLAEKYLLLSLEYVRKDLEETHLHTHSHKQIQVRASFELAELYYQQDKTHDAKLLLQDVYIQIKGEISLSQDYLFQTLLYLLKMAKFEDQMQLYQDYLLELNYLAKSDEEKLEIREIEMIELKKDKRMENESFDSLPILKANQILSHEQDVTALAKSILRYALILSKAECGVFLELDSDKKLNSLCSLHVELDDGINQLSQSVAQRCFETGQVWVSADAQNDSDFNIFDSVIDLGLQSICCLPFKSQNKILGAVYLSHRFQSHLFSESLLELLENYLQQAAVLYENIQSLEKVREDNSKLRKQLTQSQEQNFAYASILESQSTLDLHSASKDIIANSPKMIKVLDLVNKIAPTTLSVLVEGESGTGKELIARALHLNSRRSDKNFIAINCGAISENLIESELFGHVAGAFTGAHQDKKGYFEAANGGTIFLDEIADLPLYLQVKLLRVLQEQELTRVGSTQVISVDVRIICASHQNLETWLEQKRFREDLYYRLAEIKIKIPPLKERREDIPLLIKHFIKKYEQENALTEKLKLKKSLMQAYLDYDWPGNVRELISKIRVACALSENNELSLESLPSSDREKLKLIENKENINTVKKSLSDFIMDCLAKKKNWPEIEKMILLQALQDQAENISQAAQSLNIGQATLYKKVEKENLRALLNHSNLKFFNLENKSLREIKLQTIRTYLAEHEQRVYEVSEILNISTVTIYKCIT